MKTTPSKPSLLVSVAAAARLFIRISAMDIDSASKCAIMTMVSNIISGDLDISDAVFSEEGEDIRSELVKALDRSAKARAAAARRRAVSSIKVMSDATDTDVKSVPEAHVEVAPSSSNEIIVVPNEKISDGEHPCEVRKKRRHRRRRRH